jgi:hypothetical protein
MDGRAADAMTQGYIASIGLPLPLVGHFIAIADHRSMSAV